MNVRRALTYLFADPRWPGKLGIAMLLNLLPTALIAYRQLVMDNGDPQSADPLGNLLWIGATTFAMIPVYGYLLRIVRNVVAGADLLLPEWTDGQRLLHDGLSLWCIVVLWGCLPRCSRRSATRRSSETIWDGPWWWRQLSGHTCSSCSTTCMGRSTRGQCGDSDRPLSTSDV
ncbi:MAG: hypothetical protein K0S78_4438 [Thermomicrobiales bacterium]|jgi:hypothetical protein|nr:hypothetical protein [Thermomicrobiales bacterium]MDF3040690.1 hypothetical protein [Thermomicrobiales bacterium]